MVGLRPSSWQRSARYSPAIPLPMINGRRAASVTPGNGSVLLKRARPCAPERPHDGGRDMRGSGIDWRTVVEVREDPALAALLARRLPPEGRPRSVSVTDLTGLRPAYWGALVRAVRAPEREERIAAGRALHRRIGSALSGYGLLEVRVRRGGVAGRIDLLADVPWELKTGSDLVPPGDLLEARPDQVEQLAMYAALTDRPSGRLVTFALEGGEVTGAQAVDARLADLDAVRAETFRRAERLRAAWRARSPEGLPRCRWFGRGCEFQAAEVCGCTGDEPVEPSELLRGVRPVEDRPDLAEEILARFRARSVREPTIARFRDLLYLRRTYYDRTVGPPPPSPQLPDPLGPADLYERLRESVESGPVGEVASLPTRSDEPEEEVAGFGGVPWMLRVTRAWERPTALGLVERYPQYALELGFRCVAAGQSTGRLVVGWERAVDERERVAAYDVHFSSPTVLARLWRDRVRALARAIADRSPGTLDPCPAWMPPTCPYVAECGCADAAGRSQR
jgi:hypothetical protein